VADIYTGSFEPDRDLEHLDKLIERLDDLAENTDILKSKNPFFVKIRSYYKRRFRHSGHMYILKNVNLSDPEASDGSGVIYTY
jgi:hypothetical protein